jgi:transposase InsO family protein
MDQLSDILAKLSQKQKMRAQELYELLEPLTDPELSNEERQKGRLEACTQLGVSSRTLRRLMRTLKTRGAALLVRKERSDKGRNRKMDSALLQAAIGLLREEPRRSVPKLKQLLSADPKWQGPVNSISVKTLGLHLRKAGWGHDHRAAVLGKDRVYHRFEALFPNELWQGDARDGIPLPHPEKKGKTRMTYLFAFLDDYSRLIVYARYYWDEKLPRMEDCFRQAVLSRGIPEKVYLDNGSVYIAGHFSLLLNGIGTRKLHHPAYSAWCKGKVEMTMKRFKQFQMEARLAGMQTLAELNSALHSWIEMEYNGKIHTTTGETPNDRFRNGLVRRPARRVGDLEKFNELFFHREERTVDKYRKVSLFGNVYKVSGLGAGEPVEVRFDPFDLRTVKLYHEGKYHSLLQADTLTRETAAERLPEESKDIKPSKAAQLYFALLRQKHHDLLQERKDHVRYSDLKEEKKND